MGIVPALSTMTKEAPSDYGWQFYDFGERCIWPNRQNVAPFANLSVIADNVLCTRMREDSNSTQMITELMDSGGTIALEEDGWVAVSQEVDTYVTGTEYSISRSVDTMATVSMVLIIGGVFALYASEDFRSRKREIALLRSIGGDTVDVAKIQIAELVVLSLFAMLLLILYSPFLIINNLLTHVQSIGDFPVRVFIVIPWASFLSILSFFIGCILVIVTILAIVNTRINLSEALNADWAEAGPHHEDF